MIVVCAWCKKVIKEKEPLRNKSITHGICNECDKKVKEKYNMNPPTEWHEERIRVAKVNYSKRKVDYNFWYGYIKAHRKFIELEDKGNEPNYEKYVKLFVEKYYEAKGEHINYWAGCRYAAIESRSEMKRS